MADTEMPTRRIVAGLFMSLDGVVESPEKWGFPYMNQEMTDRIAMGIANADAVLLGPRTYQMFSQLWPHQDDSVPMARFLNGSPKYVVSDGATALDWQPAVAITGNLRDELAKVKNKPGKNIQVPGSPRLVRSLLRDGLLDEFSLCICPIVVGAGMRLFDEMPAAVRLDLVDSTIFDNGVLGVTYRPVQSGDQAAPSLHFPHAVVPT